MGSLKLYGMRSAYDEVMAAGIKRQHEPPRIVGDLLQSEIAEKQARSIRYQMTVAKLPLAKDIEEFNFTGTPINEGLVRELANGSFVADQRNVVLIGGTGTGKIISPSPLHARSSAAAPAADSTTSSIW
jgi:DNA replication protein DnaC